MQDKKIGLCLSGGGGRGFAHLGALQAFSENGIQFTMISGSSAGAIAAALFAAGIPPKEALANLSQIGIFTNLNFAFNKFGLFKLNKAGKLVEKMIPHNSFEDLNIPIAVCATDIGRGIAHYFESGNLSDAVMASCSIPGLFSPKVIDGHKYIDGGVIDNLPLEPLKSKCNYFIGVNVTPFEKRLPVKSAKDVIMKSLFISVDNQTRSKSKEFDLIIEPKNISKYNGLSTQKAQELFDLGYESTMDVINSNKLLFN